MLILIKGVRLLSNSGSTISTCLCDWIRRSSSIVNPRVCRQKYSCSSYHYLDTWVANFNRKSAQPPLIVQSDQKIDLATTSCHITFHALSYAWSSGRNSGGGGPFHLPLDLRNLLFDQANEESEGAG